MKGLLNNPKLVFALAIGAFVVAGNNILSPLMSNGSFSSEEVIPPVGIKFGDSEAIVNRVFSNQVSAPAATMAETQIDDTHLLQTDTQKIPEIGWAMVPSRDPFRFANEAKSEKINLDSQSAVAEEKLDTVGEETLGRTPEKVSAVVIGPAFKLAVVDGELLRPGDEMLGGSVTVLNEGAIEYENAIGIKQTIPIEQLNLDPNTQ